MQAAIYSMPGAPSVLTFGDIPDPILRDDHILVRVEAISIEGGDLVNRQTTPPQDTYVPLGYAAAGIIVGLGRDVRCFDLGQRVATFDFLGSHATLRAVRAAACWIVPEGLDPAIAAAVPCGPGTAAIALQLGGLRAGQTVLVQGAAGGVGVAAIQLARQRGARVIGTGTSRETLDRLSPLGMDVGVVVGDAPVPELVLALTEGQGVDLVIDNVGGPAITEGLHACREGGTLVLVGVLGGKAEQIDAWSLLQRRQTVIGCLLGVIIAEPGPHAMIAELLDEAAAGRLYVPIDRRFPLSQAAAAHRHAELRGRIGRVVIEP